ncbi:MAG: CoA ester lyase [Rhodospirillales bacterium]|nr:CoA ester lyase [Rhodospirillales bacterium]
MREHAHRTYLFTPGNHPRRVEKAFTLATDVVILDLEDAVAVAEKVKTRDIVRETLAKPRETAAFVRVNAYDTPFCYGDICAVVCPELDGIMLPKLESVADLKSVEWLIANLEREQGMEVGTIDLLPIIETAKGAANLRDMVLAGSRVKRFAFGAGDYTRDLGMDWTMEEAELLPIRSEMVLASRLGGLEPPIDTVYIHIKEHDLFKQSCDTVRALGFQGKLCIHPDQIGPANTAFSPTADSIAWSEKIVAAFDEAEKQGVASIQVDGYFVDYPIVEKAQRTVDLANVLRKLGKI